MNQKRTAKAALATFGLSVLMPTAAFAATDIQGHWAGSVLEKWESQNLISGYEDNTIRPDNEISRAEFVALVNRVAGYTAVGNAVTLSDVKTGDWFASQVAVAVNQGYIGGFEDGTFRPNDSVTRAQAASILARIKNLTNDTARADQFADKANIPAWAKGVIGAVANAGYMIGNDANEFQADKALTRAEAVAALDRVFGVKDLAEQTITLSAKEGVISKGSSRTITATTSVEGAVISAVSSDESVATVSVKDGKITIKGIEKGSAVITITVKADGYKPASATYNVDVTAAGSAGGGGGSSSGGSSSKTETLTPVVSDAAKDDSSIQVIYKIEDESADVDATIEIKNLPSSATVTKAVLKEGTTLQVKVGENLINFSLEKDIVKGTADVVSNTINITVADVYEALADGSEAKTKLKALYDSSKKDDALVIGTIDGDTISWKCADGYAIVDWAKVFAGMRITVTK